MCDVQGNGQDHRHKLADCRLKGGVYTTLDALSGSPDALEKRLQTTGQSDSKSRLDWISVRRRPRAPLEPSGNPDLLATITRGRSPRVSILFHSGPGGLAVGAAPYQAREFS